MSLYMCSYMSLYICLYTCVLSVHIIIHLSICWFAFYAFVSLFIYSCLCIISDIIYTDSYKYTNIMYIYIYIIYDILYAGMCMCVCVWHDVIRYSRSDGRLHSNRTRSSQNYWHTARSKAIVNGGQGKLITSSAMHSMRHDPELLNCWDLLVKMRKVASPTLTTKDFRAWQTMTDLTPFWPHEWL